MVQFSVNGGYGLCLQKERSPSRFHRFLENPGILESRMERSINAVVPKLKVTLKFLSAAIIKTQVLKICPSLKLREISFGWTEPSLSRHCIKSEDPLISCGNYCSGQTNQSSSESEACRDFGPGCSGDAMRGRWPASWPLPTRQNLLDHSRRWAVPTYSPTQYFVLENSRNSGISESRKSMLKKRSVVVGFSVAVTEHWPKAVWGRKGLFHLTAPSLSTREARGTRGRDWSRDYQGELLPGFFTKACSAPFL